MKKGSVIAFLLVVVLLFLNISTVFAEYSEVAQPNEVAENYITDYEEEQQTSELEQVDEEKQEDEQEQTSVDEQASADEQASEEEQVSEQETLIRTVIDALGMGRALPSGLTFTADIAHTRTAITPLGDYYNGERVELTFTFTGANIAVGDEYLLEGLFEEKDPGSSATWAYLINMDDSSINIESSGLPVGQAQYDKATKKIKIKFNQLISPADISTFTIKGNLAIKGIDGASTAEALHFDLWDDLGTGNETAQANINTTNEGFKVTPTFSRTTNVLNYSTVTVKLNWEAKAGIGIDDFFVVEIPWLDDPGLGMGITFQQGSGTGVPITDGTIYGEAIYHYKGTNRYSASTISCNFNQNGSNNLNIKGTVTLEGQYYLWTDNTISVLPNTKDIIVYINGEEYKIELGIGPPNLNSRNTSISKSSRVGADISNDPAVNGRGFYRFGWTLVVNRDNLPIFNPPAGGIRQNVKVKDSVEGPGHYIDKDSIVIGCVGGFTVLGDPIYKQIKDWPNVNMPNPNVSNPAATSISVGRFIQIFGADKFEAVAYDTTVGSNKIKEFTLKFGDLDAVAMEVMYTSYIEDGSSITPPIDSFKDYFFKSLLNDKKTSDKYFNRAVMYSDTNVEIPVVSELMTTNMSSSMQSGNVKLKIKKVDKDGNPQQGVKFKLHWLGGSTPVSQTDVNGYLEFVGMGADYYKLEEVTPLTGYEPMDAIDFIIPPTVSAGILNDYMDLTDPVFKASGGIANLALITADPNEYVNKITNFKKPDPSNPGPSNPGPSNPGPGNPGPSNPGPGNPEPGNPDPSNPDPQEPDQQTVEPSVPETKPSKPESSTVKTPDPKSPRVPSKTKKTMGVNTGDGTNLLIPICFIIVCGCGLAVCIIRKEAD